MDAGLYLVERYLPGVRDEEVAAASVRLRAAAAELAADGTDVRYLGSTYVPEEESCFSHFEAASRAAVELALERARVPFARVSEARAVHGDKEEQCEFLH